MASVQAFREKFPQYDNVPTPKLVDALRRKFNAETGNDVSLQEFATHLDDFEVVTGMDFAEARRTDARRSQPGVATPLPPSPAVAERALARLSEPDPRVSGVALPPVGPQIPAAGRAQSVQGERLTFDEGEPVPLAGADLPAFPDAQAAAVAEGQPRPTTAALRGFLDTAASLLTPLVLRKEISRAVAAEFQERIAASPSMSGEDFNALMRDIVRSRVPPLVQVELLGIANDVRTGRRSADEPMFEGNLAETAQTAVTEFGEERLPLSEAEEQRFANKVFRGMGSTGVFVLARKLPAGPAVLPIAAVTVGQGEAIERAAENGASLDVQAQSALLGSILGVTDVAAIEILFRPLDRVPGARGAMGAIAKRMVEAGLVEGTQEAIQQFAQNVIVKFNSLSSQDLAEGVAEAGVVGLVVGLVFGAMSGTSQATTPQPGGPDDAEIPRLPAPERPPRTSAQEEGERPQAEISPVAPASAEPQGARGGLTADQIRGVVRNLRTRTPVQPGAPTDELAPRRLEAPAVTPEPPEVAPEVPPVSPEAPEAPEQAPEAPSISRSDIGAMTLESAKADLEAKSAIDRENLIEAIGRERVPRFERLDRDRNSNNADRADRASKAFDEEFGDLTPEQERLIFGIGESGRQTEHLRDLVAALEPLEGATETDLGRALTLGLLATGKAALNQVKSTGQGSDKDELAFVRVRQANAEAQRRGIDVDRLIMRAMESRGFSTGDAIEILRASFPRQAPSETSGQAPGIATQTPAQAPRRSRSEAASQRFAKERQVDARGDNIFAAIAKLGGISREDAERSGVDPAEFKRKGFKIFGVFTKNGDTVEGMAERLAEFNFPVLDETGTFSGNKLLEALEEGFSGRDVLSIAGTEARAELEQQEAPPEDPADDPFPGEMLAPEEYDEALDPFGRRMRELSDELELLESGAGEALVERGAIQSLSNEQIIFQLEDAIRDRAERPSAEAVTPGQRPGEAGQAPISAAQPQDADEGRPTERPRAGTTGDLLGDDTGTAQALADRARRAGERLGEERDQPPLDAPPGTLFGPQGQTDLTDQPAVIELSKVQIGPRKFIDVPSTVFRGHGRKEKIAGVAGGALGPVLGTGRYFAFTEKQAQAFGPEVERLPTAELRSPLVISSDEEWKELTSAAGWKFPNPAASDPVRLERERDRLVEVMNSRGHDSLAIVWDDSLVADFWQDANGGIHGVKLLNRVFGIPQIFVPSAKTRTENAQSDRPVTTRSNREGVTTRNTVVDRFIDPERIIPPHAPDDAKKLKQLTAAMREDGFVGRSIIVFDNGDGVHAVTGSNRLAAANEAELTEVPVIDVDFDLIEAHSEQTDESFLGDVIGKDDDRVQQFLRAAGDIRAADAMAEEIKANESGFTVNSRPIRTSNAAGTAFVDPLRRQPLPEPPADEPPGAPAAGVGVPKPPKRPKKPLRRDDIIKKIEKKLGVKVYQGRVKGSKDRLGFYKDRLEELRIRFHNDIEVAAHEVFHFLDDTFPMFGAAYRQEPFREELLSISYDDKKDNEGFAEFGRLFLTQEENAVLRAPLFYDRFVDLIRGTELEPVLEEIQADMHAWYRQGALDRFKSKIGKSPLQVRQKLDALLDQLGDRAIAQIFDEFHGIKVLERDLTGEIGKAELSPYKAFRLVRGVQGVQRHIFEHGTLDWNSDGDLVISGPGLRQVFEPVADVLDDTMNFFVASRAKELLGQGREALFRPDEIEAGLALAPNNTEAGRRIRRAFTEFQRFNRRMLDFAQGAGLLNDSTREAMEEMNTAYVPFFRIQENAVGETGKGRALFQRLRGGTQNIHDVWENIMTNVAIMTDAAVKNMAKRKLYDMVDASRGSARFAVKIPKDTRTIAIERRQLVVAFLEAAGFGKLDAGRMARQFEQGGDITDMPGPIFELLKIMDENLGDFATFYTFGNAPQGGNIDSVMRDGERVFYEIADPMMLASVMALGPRQLNMGLRIAAGFKVTFTRLVTSMPSFQIPNLMRDGFSGWAFSEGGMIPVVDSVRGFADRLQETDEYWEYLANGGGFVSTAQAEANITDKLERFYLDRGISFDLVLHTPRKVLRIWDEFNSAFEYGTRLAEFKTLRAMGATRQEAAFGGREISTDFAMRGLSDFLRMFTTTVPFMGARIQGMYKIEREVFEKGGKQSTVGENVARLAFRALIGITIPSMLLWWYNHDDPRYQALDEWIKDLHWVILLPGQEDVFLIPKPFEVGAIFATLPERMLELYVARDGRKFMESLVFLLGEQLALNPVPQIVRPWFDLMTNRKFTGAPIIPEDLKDVAPSEQFRPWTSETMIQLGKHTDLSPIKTEALMRGYLGTFASYLLMASDSMVTGDVGGERPDTPIQEMPIIRRFVRRFPLRSTRYQTEFYRMAAEVREITATMNKIVKEGRDPAVYLDSAERQALFSIQQGMAAFKTEAALIRRSIRITQLDKGLNGREKREQIDQYQTQLNQLMESAAKTFSRKQVEEIGAQLERTE